MAWGQRAERRYPPPGNCFGAKTAGLRKIPRAGEKKLVAKDGVREQRQGGDQFGAGEAFLPELVMAGEAMKAAVAVLEPELLKLGEARETMGKVILATVEGDIHEIGKTLVGTMLSASGFEVTDLGVDQPADKIIGKALEIDAQIIGLSALLTTTMVRQREIIEELDKENLRPRIKVMLGVSPITRDWATKIKADGTSEDAVGAVALAKQLVGKA